MADKHPDRAPRASGAATAKKRTDDKAGHRRGAASQVVVRVVSRRGLPPQIVAVYGDDDELITVSPVEAGRALIEVPEHYVGRAVRVLHAPAQQHTDAPTIDRLRRALAVEDRLILGAEVQLKFDPEALFKRWRLACCRVRGRVVVKVRMPDGSTADRPLCNARVVICEVDRSFPRIVERLPNHLVFRLRDDLTRAIVDPPHDLMASPLDRAIRSGVAVATKTDAATREPDGLGSRIQALHGPLGAAALRGTIVGLRDVLRPFWRCFDWLEPFYDLDCIASAEVAEDGTFDTEITYPCSGDRPDLYFKVEQNCHPGGWKTVHAPGVHCNTHWDYCCGDEITIEVTHPAAVAGRSPTPCSWPYDASDPSSVGSWEMLPYSSGVFVVHAALLPTAKVLLWSGTAEVGLPRQSRVWDPVTATMTAQTYGDDLFCAGHAQMADGRILVNGGSANAGSGIRSTHIFDPIAETWTKVADMGYPRWYPTTLTLPDGRIFTFSGRGGESKTEVYDPSGDTWSELVPASPRSIDIYPSLHVMPDGRIFYTGTRWAGGPAWPSPPITALFDPTTATWADVDDHVIANRTEGTSVLLAAKAPVARMHRHDDVPKKPKAPPSLTRVLVLGGAGDNPGDSRSAEIIDLADPSPVWRRIADMSYSRVNANAVILPDATVLVCSGIDGFKWGPNTASLAAELFDPETETWTVMAAMSVMRQYHSVAVLLADGRVLSTGSVGPGGNNTTMEVFSPPYLYRGPRPTVSSCPATLGYGAKFDVTSPAACRIDHVALVRCTTVTHHTNTDQRYLRLDWHRQGDCGLRVSGPANANLAPPGYYLLFLLDDCGVPSVGRFICIG